MSGFLPAEIASALRSMREGYKQRRLAFVAQPGANAAGGLAIADKMIAALDRAIATGEMPVANMTASLRSTPKFLSHPVASLSRGEMVQLLGVDGHKSVATATFWQVRSHSGVTGWISRKELFPDPPALLTSHAGTGGPWKDTSNREEVELGARDTVVW